MHPKVAAEDGVEVHAASERFDGKDAILDGQAPGYVVLLQGEGQLGFVRLVFGQEAEEDVCFPLVAFAIIPAGTYGQEAHVAGKLKFAVGGYQLLPMFAVSVYALVVAAVW